MRHYRGSCEIPNTVMNVEVNVLHLSFQVAKMVIGTSLTVSEVV